MTFRRLATLAVVGGCAAATLAGTPTQAATAESVRETGRVTYITDGDTVNVLVDGTEQPVRLLGVQAMEAYHPSEPGSFDACHAAAAREELDALVMGKTVQLRAMSSSSTNRGRLLRSVWVQQGGVWVDVQKVLLQKALVLPLPSSTESTHNDEYMTLAQQVASGGTGIWDTTSCGSGPSQDVPLKLIVHGDADGDDAVNVNGEWASVQNVDPSRSISLKGWWLRDSSLTYYTFTSTTTLAPGQRVTVKVGKGSDTTVSRYWGQTAPVFDNGGDGAYLFDPAGDLRAWMMYPCMTSCSDPETGNLTIKNVSYDPPGSDTVHINSEWVKIKNTSAHPIALRPYQVHSWPYSYTFDPATVLDPGVTLLLRVGKGTATETTRYWGRTSPILNNSGDRVELLTYDDIRLSCEAWGTLAC